jgi:tripeptide aminopeptidase
MHNKYVPELEERFVRYVQIDTMADDTSPSSPSTAKQYDLLNLLAEELNAIGASDVRITDYGAVLATIPGRGPRAHRAPTVAFLAHVDTIPGFSGAGVKPQVHRNYAGGALPLPEAPELLLSPETSPNLAKKVGYDIVTPPAAPPSWARTTSAASRSSWRWPTNCCTTQPSSMAPCASASPPTKRSAAASIRACRPT